MNLTAQKWFVVTNDVIGGWDVANVDKPVSSIDTRGGSEFVIAECLSKGLAEYIVSLHNWNIEGEVL